MKKYLGVKLIEAEPMSLGDYNDFKGWVIPPDEDPKSEGYKVKYSDDYISWSPKEEFEKYYFPLADPEGKKIIEEDVIKMVKGQEAVRWGEKTTSVYVTLRNGFVISESSSCVDADNFDMIIGADICINKIKNKVWELLGFLLQCGRNGLK